ncbi:mechanosensitive ion channel [Bizionia gelidisalsuginis]|uniref:Mechanosensitive ion channel n=1 Tax=Bizionia gelidisalsuginis TaxID=291188 RepID=A0ABY3M8I9_9FLAO|nr:mechanosensitive ion channel domain-containing protein [Bizionia gelidisalsuginis]TYC10554.1 mechanosensitive ion channel [Bizionia gelidisalsuginis]
MDFSQIKFLDTFESWVTYTIVIVACILLGLTIRWILFSIVKLSNKRRPSVLKTQLLLQLKTAAKFLLPILFIYSSFQFLEVTTFWKKITESLIIINFSWLVIAFLNAIEEVVKEKFTINNNHKAKDRKALTQLRFLKSISIVIIITLAVAAILWNIPSVKKVGTTLLTSAGVIGIIAGVAAQKSIANLITGFQIAFTQPIKIDDEVVIQGEFGTVEDITLTYVVIKLWDWRRLVLPLSYFNDNSFVNWTFNSQELIGTVFFQVDYTFPVAEMRKKLLELLHNNTLWDKNIAKLVVSNTNATTMELRATFSAKNASDVWDLRCEVREQLIAFIQKNHPECFPTLRQINLSEDLK